MPLHRQSLHSSVCGTMLAGWASSSRKQYQVYFHKWITFAKLYNYPLDAPSVPQGLLFLQHLLDGGTKYSGLNTARSMLSTFLVFPGGKTFGKHPHVTRFMRGVSKLCPSVPKYDDTWDPTVVVDLLSSWGKTAHLALHLLTKRTLVLFLLATGQMVQTAHALKRQDIVFNEEVCRVTVSEDVKHSKRYAKKQAFRFRRFNKEEMCLYTHLEQYLRITPTTEEFLFFSFGGKKTRATKGTLARYVKQVLTEAGVPQRFGPHSVRSASTSAALRAGVQVDTVLKQAGWSRHSTFTRFYNRDTISQSDYAGIQAIQAIQEAAKPDPY